MLKLAESQIAAKGTSPLHGFDQNPEAGAVDEGNPFQINDEPDLPGLDERAESALDEIPSVDV